MFKRILRSLTVLAALVAAYQAYVLLAVPLMEPPIAIRQAAQVSRDQRDLAAGSVTKYQILLSNYFPKDHWSQTRPPKVIASSNEQAMLVLDDYKRHDDGRVIIERFSLLIFPTPPREGITPPRDTIILEAPQGAQLQFDDFHPERGQIGQITRGRFPGRITIRSDMREEGPEDDLLVETSDLEMNTKLLYTMSPVRFRMGPNVGGGRELEIRFLADEHMQARDAGLKIAGIDALEIRRDVRLRMELETASLLPGEEKKSEPSPDPVRPGSPQASLTGSGNKENSPVEVKCSGPFTFDFVRYVASLDRDVELRQIKANGPSDQIFCSQLDIHFAPRQLPANGSQPLVVDPGKRQQRDLGRLEPAAIVAQGHPVVVTSPERNAQARGDRIQIVLRDQRVRITAAREAELIYGTNVLRAPVIDYQHPVRDASTAIGRFRATGPGSLHYVPDPAKSQQAFDAAWQSTVELGREKGQPVLTMEGRPQFAFSDAGSLTADRMKIYLRELQGDGASGPGLTVSAGGDTASKMQIVPDRLIASGRVDIRSGGTTCRTSELLVTFRLQPPTAPGQTPVDESPKADLKNQLIGNPSNGSRPAFHVGADKMQLEVQVRGQSALPSTLSCEGNIVFREIPSTATDEQPMEIRGEQLTVDRMESSAPYVTLRGVRPGQANGSKFAQLSGRGVTMLVDVVEIDVRENRIRSDGPGKATLLVTRDLQGQASATPFPLDLTWQGGLQFNGGRTITFERDVQVAGADDTLRCNRLSAKLSAPIVFSEGVDQKAIDLLEIECDGQVTINHLTRDKVGVISHERMQLARLTINQQTGAIAGIGPGVIRSTRFGGGLAALVGPQDPAAPQLVAPPPGAAGSKLHFLRVDFQRGLAGNLYTRELSFQQRVRAVYGPVDAWEQELDPTRSESLPPEAMTLSCDELRINEDPVAARAVAKTPGDGSQPIGPVQLKAEGSVQINGQVPKQGAFSAQADRASYDQAKDAFILEGDSPRSPATLWRAGQQGPPPSARWIRYVRSTGEISVDGIQYLEITPQDIENARLPKQVR